MGEESLELFVESISDYAIYMLDPHGQVSSWNLGAQAIKGYVAGEIVGQNFAVFYSPEDRLAKRPEHTLQVAREQGRFEEEGWRIRKDGSRFWANVVVTGVRKNGALVGFAKVTRDLSERRKHDAELHLRKVITENMAEGLVLVRTADWTVVYANERAAALAGYTAAELIGRPAEFADATNPVVAATRAKLAADIARSGVGLLEREFTRKDGSRFWMQSRASAIAHPEHGELWAILVDDVTDKRATEAAQKKALSLSEARFARLNESGVIGIFVATAPDGRVLEVNDSFLLMTGYGRDEFLSGSVTLLSITPKDWDDDAASAMVRMVQSGVSVPREKEYVRKDGTRLPALVAAAALEDATFIACAIDLSARKGAESQLRRTQEQLQHAQKMEAVGRLAGGVAHDFNNLLSVILSYAELLHASLHEGDPMREDIGEIRAAANRATALTRQLLLFSRQQVIEPQVVDLRESLGSMAKMLKRLVGEDVDVTLVNAADLGCVRVDVGQLEQVIMNLVVNARDAMATGGRLTIETTNVELDEGYASAHVGAKAGPHVMLAVTDTGSGIDAETRARIFEPFFTTKPPGKGTGLGLSVVFGIVQNAGGSVWVYSEVGHGTTFKVYLPRVDLVAQAPRAAAAPVSLCGSETILLVEDERQVRAVAKEILKRQGYFVIEAQNAGEALLLCERHPGVIHLLLSDVVMPGMSGPELAKRLQSVRPEMRVLCMSGYTDDSIVRHGVVSSGVPYLQKPITPDSLAKKVREVLDS